MRADLGAVADFHLGTDDRIGADTTLAPIRAAGSTRAVGWIMVRCPAWRAHEDGFGTIWPSTLPSALYFQMPRIWRRISTCRCNWSPASPAFLKRAVIDADKIEHRVGVRLPPMVLKEPRRLGQGLHDQDAGHHRVVGGMPWKNGSLMVTFL